MYICINIHVHPWSKFCGYKTNLSIYLSVCLSACPSVYMSNCLSVYLSLYLFLSQHLGYDVLNRLQNKLTLQIICKYVFTNIYIYICIIYVYIYINNCMSLYIMIFVIFWKHARKKDLQKISYESRRTQQSLAAAPDPSGRNMRWRRRRSMSSPKRIRVDHVIYQHQQALNFGPTVSDRIHVFRGCCEMPQPPRPEALFVNREVDDIGCVTWIFVWGWSATICLWWTPHLYQTSWASSSQKGLKQEGIETTSGRHAFLHSKNKTMLFEKRRWGPWPWRTTKPCTS